MPPDVVTTHSPTGWRAHLTLTRPEWALVVITLFWGATFLAVQLALTVSGPLFFVGARFGTAAVLLALLALPRLRRFNRQEVAAGSLIGVAIFLGYTLQTWGLKTIPSSQSAFLTALYVPAVPLLQWVFGRKSPGVMAWVGIALAFGGVVLMTGPSATVGSLGLGQGEVLTLLAAVVLAAEILLIGRYAGKVDAQRVTVMQVAVTAVLAFLAMPALGEPVPGFSWTLVLLAGGMGLASAVIQFTMNWAQRTVSPTRATVIYAGEPLWAGLFGRLAGERLSSLAWLGGLCIVSAVLVSGWKRRERS